MDFDTDQETITPNLQTYIRVNTTGALWGPAGTTAQRPTGQIGMTRVSSTSTFLEYYNGTVWVQLPEVLHPFLLMGA